MDAKRHIQDQLLQLIYVDPEQGLAAENIATTLNVTIKDAFRLLENIEYLHPDFIKLNSSYGKDKFTVYGYDNESENVADFLLDGGYTEYYAALEKEKKKQQERERLEIDNLTATTRAAKTSWWAIAIAFMSLIVASIALYLQWRGK